MNLKRLKKTAKLDIGPMLCTIINVQQHLHHLLLVIPVNNNNKKVKPYFKNKLAV
jgi:hypothetical protein